MKNIEILMYSEKSFIVIGDTKEIKEQFKLNNAYLGRYNRFLKVKDELTDEETKQAGWVFALKHKEFVERIVNEYLGNKIVIVEEDLRNEIIENSESFVTNIIEQDNEQQELF